MFSSGILDVAIGLIFIYLLLSLVCSAINEIIEARLKRRATTLERGIRELLNDPTGRGLVQRLYNHPLIYGLFQGSYDPDKINNTTNRYQGGSNLPSYIPARNFALALMDIALPPKPTTSGTSPPSSDTTGATTPPTTPAAATNPLQPLRETIDLIQNPKVEQALMTLVDAAGNDIDKVRENIETWYNSAMDRVSGWYKRQVQQITLILGLSVTIAVNADTISVGNSLSRDVAMRNSLVAATQEYAKANSSDPLSPSPNPQSELEVCHKDEHSPECKVAKNLREIQKLGLPLGWNTDDPRTVPRTPGGWLVKILGWLLTATAISLGAPFWFDLLNKFMVVRATVKPHEKSPEEPAVDRE